jgi:hypothetical protein
LLGDDHQRRKGGRKPEPSIAAHALGPGTRPGYGRVLSLEFRDLFEALLRERSCLHLVQ